MQIIAHEHGIGGRVEDDIAGWNFPLKINRALWQYQSYQRRKKSGESLRDTQKPNTGLSQRGLNERRIRFEADDRCIVAAIYECVDVGLTRKRQQHEVFRIDAANSENVFAHHSRAGADRTRSDAFALEFRQVVQHLSRTI